MAAASTEDESSAVTNEEPKLERTESHAKPAQHDSEADDGDDDDDDEADEEPKLKYTRLTSNLAPVYRNGDATSSFLVAGDKMVRRMLQASSHPPSQSIC